MHFVTANTERITCFLPAQSRESINAQWSPKHAYKTHQTKNPILLQLCIGIWHCSTEAHGTRNGRSISLTIWQILAIHKSDPLQPATVTQYRAQCEYVCRNEPRGLCTMQTYFLKCPGIWRIRALYVWCTWCPLFSSLQTGTYREDEFRAMYLLVELFCLVTKNDIEPTWIMFMQ